MNSYVNTTCNICSIKGIDNANEHWSPLVKGFTTDRLWSQRIDFVQWTRNQIVSKAWNQEILKCSHQNNGSGQLPDSTGHKCKSSWLFISFFSSLYSEYLVPHNPSIPCSQPFNNSQTLLPGNWPNILKFSLIFHDSILPYPFKWPLNSDIVCMYRDSLKSWEYILFF